MNFIQMQKKNYDMYKSTPIYFDVTLKQIQVNRYLTFSQNDNIMEFSIHDNNFKYFDYFFTVIVNK